MFKHVVLLIGLSVAAIFFQDQLMAALRFFMLVHTELAKGLGDIFSVDKIGEIVQSVFALLLIPVVVGVLLSVLHLFIRKHQFPHTMTTIWVAWAILLVSVLSQTGRVTNHVACFTTTKMTQATNVTVAKNVTMGSAPSQPAPAQSAPQRVPSIPQQG